MKYLWLTVTLLFLSFGSSWAQQETAENTDPPAQTKKLKLHVDLNDIIANSESRQEHVEVQAESYPGLNLDLSTAADEASHYKPRKFSIDLLKKDYLLYDNYSYKLTGTARPHKSGKVVEVSVPVD